MAKVGKRERQELNLKSKYNIVTNIGEGGNARVYLVQNIDSGEKLAAKLLSIFNEEKKARFLDEITIMVNNLGIDGILPIEDYDLDNYWYIMPIATPLQEWSQTIKNKCLENQSGYNRTNVSGWLESVIQGFISLAATLELLHDKNIHHRDIKPDNLYYFNSKFCFGDFGLVEFPDSQNNLTRTDMGLGAIFTIAPEMKRNPKEADGAKADVYSLAKTLWMILTQDGKGFDGQYNSNDPSHGLRFYKSLENEYLVEIEELLHQATANDPQSRPSIKQFGDTLSKWNESHKSRMIKEVNEWSFIANRVFGDNIPFRTEYRDPHTIVKVLNILAKTSAMNHMFFPGSGGLDFTGCEIAPEPGFIYVYTGNSINLMKPKCLIFESFEDPQWNYFLIEAENIEPIEDFFVSRYGDQYLVEDVPGHYVSADDAVYGVYDYDSGERLPKGYKIVQRFIHGKFLIVMKLGGYNGIADTYDGRHSIMSNEELRKYIEQLQTIVQKGVSLGLKETEILRMKELGAHPYPERIDEPIIKESEPLPTPDSFILENYTNWEFSEFFNFKSKSGKLAFSFFFTLDNMQNIFEAADVWYLGIDGKIHKEAPGSTECFKVFDREQAVKLVKELNDSITKRCEGYDISALEIKYNFTIDFSRIDMPRHIFTKDEIKNEMRNADDRLRNQLVIDEDGYAHVLPIVDYEPGTLYPVSNSIWGDRNNYVGKYSPLYTLDDDYIDMLSCWLSYLETGHHQTCYINVDQDEKQLKNKISTFYSESK